MSSPTPDLRGKVVAITGAGRGIGAATATALHRAGALVAIGDLDLATAEQTAKKIGDDVPAMPDQAGDNGASRAALGAEFGLLSFGPDQRWNPQVRADPAGFNEDNIVRFGP